MRRHTLLAAAIASGVACVVCALAGAPAARAAEPDAATRAANGLTAVRLTDEAAELFEAGKYADALDRYQRADALVRRHSIGVRIARCLARLGRLNEAAERYLAVSRAALPADLEPEKLAKQKEAIAQAERERDALLPRIPAIVVQLAGPPDAAVTVDGQSLPAALLGVKRSIDPGPHRVEARAGADVVARDVILEEAQVLTVPLELHAPAPPFVPPVPPSLVLPPPPRLPPREKPAGSAPVRRAVGFAGIGVGAAGIAVGLVSGVVAVVKRADLVTKCTEALLCKPELGGEVNAYNGERAAASLGLVVGAIVAAAGVVLVVTAPATKPAASVSLFAGPTGAGLRGGF